MCTPTHIHRVCGTVQIIETSDVTDPLTFEVGAGEVMGNKMFQVQIAASLPEPYNVVSAPIMRPSAKRSCAKSLLQWAMLTCSVCNKHTGI